MPGTMKGKLIYKCRHCGEEVEGVDTKEYLLFEGDDAPSYETVIPEYRTPSGTTVVYKNVSVRLNAPKTIWHVCYGKAGLIIPNKYFGLCDIVGFREIPEKEPEEHE